MGTDGQDPAKTGFFNTRDRTRTWNLRFRRPKSRVVTSAQTAFVIALPHSDPSQPYPDPSQPAFVVTQKLTQEQIGTAPNGFDHAQYEYTHNQLPWRLKRRTRPSSTTTHWAGFSPPRPVTACYPPVPEAVKLSPHSVLTVFFTVASDTPVFFTEPGAAAPNPAGIGRVCRLFPVCS